MNKFNNNSNGAIMKIFVAIIIILYAVIIAVTIYAGIKSL